MNYSWNETREYKSEALAKCMDKERVIPNSLSILDTFCVASLLSFSSFTPSLLWLSIFHLKNITQKLFHVYIILFSIKSWPQWSMQHNFTILLSNWFEKITFHCIEQKLGHCMAYMLSYAVYYPNMIHFFQN